MPRYPRNYLKTMFFHVMTQGINKIYIFDKSEDIKYYIKIMYKLLKEYKLKILAYCIMKNHTHMLIKVENIDELSKFMLRLNSKYARYYNEKYDRVGYVFRDRFKSEGIYDEIHLYHCIKYIYDNPVKAGICYKAEEYKWSNYRPIEQLTDKNFMFMDVEEEMEKTYKDCILNFLKEKEIQLKDLKNNKILIKELTNILRNDYALSLRKISEELDIGREKLRKIYNE